MTQSQTSYQRLRTIPLRILRARLELTRRLERTFREAMRQRERYCDEYDIEYRTPYYSLPSQDKTHDKLFRKYIRYRVEYITLARTISQLQHEVSRATDYKTMGHEYNGAVEDIAGKVCGPYMI